MELSDTIKKDTEETKSSEESKTTFTPLKSPSFSSYIGSIGSESIVIQTVPTFKPLSLHPSPSSPRTSGPSALFEAVLANDAEKCKDLLTNVDHSAIDTNTKNLQGFTPLHVASEAGSLEVCEVLLDYGTHTEINAHNNVKRTPLHLACQSGQLDVARLLVRSGAQIDLQDINGNSALMFAAHRGDLGFVNWFLSKDPDLLVKNKFGQTALDVASGPTKDLIRSHCEKKGIMCPKRTGKREEVAMCNVCPSEFEIVKEIGRGSFGEVFLVKKAEKFYAMKVLRKEKIKAQNLIKYAMTERNVLSVIRHPFIVSLNFAFQTSEKLFLILDYCPGKDLSYHLKREKRFDENRARNYLCEILLALEELHSRNIIFRDLKPENVVLDSQGHAMLTDFGLSKEGVFDGNVARSFCGSLAYLAPEMIKRKGHGKTVDWYLLGVLFYELVAGRPPYFSMKKEELFRNIERGKLTMPNGLSDEARDLLRGLLIRDPTLRLGASGDADEVKKHPFFRDVDWESVWRRELNVPVPSTETTNSHRIPPEKVFGDLKRKVQNKVPGWTFVSD